LWAASLKRRQDPALWKKRIYKIRTCEAFLDSLQTLEPKEKIRFLFEW
jgi:hypothetical protein